MDRISSMWNLLRMSISATSVAWPTNLSNSPGCALLHRFPDVRASVEREYLFVEAF